MKSNAVLLLKTQIEFNQNVIEKNLEGISHHESMIFPNGEANSMNWIFGHLIFVRNTLLEIVGEKPVWNDEDYPFYNRGVIPVQLQYEFLDFETLKTYFRESQNRLNRALENRNDLPVENISDIAGLSLHEIYHSGQLGYIRRILGKEGAIK